MKKTLFAALVTIALTSLAFAHGNTVHILGTVTSVSDHSITVKTTTGDTKTIDVLSETKILKGDATVTLKDIQVGDRVSIHAGNENDKLHAEEIKIGAAPATQAK